MTIPLKLNTFNMYLTNDNTLKLRISTFKLI